MKSNDCYIDLNTYYENAGKLVDEREIKRINKLLEKEKKAYLRKELKEYEKVTVMTDEERAALRKWVADGNSVHENGSMACHEGGCPCDFLDDYRYQEEIRRDLEGLNNRERKNYLARLRGEDTIDNLRDDLANLILKSNIYYSVLLRYGLEGEAEKMLQDAKDKAEKMSYGFMESEELPFQ